jgi:hypothetical protein
MSVRQLRQPFNGSLAADGNVSSRIVPSESGVALNGKELLERGLRRGIPLWQIEVELDWQENQAPPPGQVRRVQEP